MKVNQAAYRDFVHEIKEVIRLSQYEALKKVNTELINLYWTIGEAIVKRQEQYEWGKSVVETLSNDLQTEYPGVSGYSTVNLWRMRKFYLEYRADLKLSPLVREIGWSHNTVIIDKCKDPLEREFYIKMTKKFGWSKVLLIHQIEGKGYERFLSNQTNFEQTLVEKYRHQAKLSVRDEYSFDFLGMSDDYSERQLELGLINNIRKFLLEMGGDFAFIGNQHRIKVDTEEFFIDLLLYHRGLQCMVAIELKTTSFKPEYAGQLQFYMTALNEQEKKAYENPAIGILICKGKNRTVVEYALKNISHPMGIASYRIESEVPEDIKEHLPSPEQIASTLEKFLE